MNTGFFCIDKPKGITSHDVVSRMRRILNMKKVGHSGTLDPMATGVLLVGCGPSTRLLDYVQAGTKEYIADLRFGMKTSSGDAQGETIDTCDMNLLTKEQLQNALGSFVGKIEQIPPMVSAIKVDGKKLYEYERDGIVIERAPRETFIESITIEEFVDSVGASSPTARLRVRCKAGTYIRTLAEDIAASLGGMAYLFALRRTRNGLVGQERCITLEELSKIDDPFSKMISPTDALSHFTQISLDSTQTLAVSHGKPFDLREEQAELIDASMEKYVVFTGNEPRKLVAIFPKDRFGEFRSRCVVFTDGLGS